MRFLICAGKQKKHAACFSVCDLKIDLKTGGFGEVGNYLILHFFGGGVQKFPN